MNEQIEYNDVERLRTVLVGRSITLVRHGKAEDDYYGRGLDLIEFVLDDGTVLEAREADGGCSCSNGCWSVASPETPAGTIMNVEVVDEKDDEWSETATLRMFVYTELGKAELIHSEGGDNGYYGWGYHVFVKQPAVSS